MSPKTHYYTFNNGLKVPQIGLGTWQTQGDEMKEVIKTAIDVGYRHIDSAFIYGNEAIVGEAVREKIAQGVIKREDIFITTKLWITEHSPEKIIPACQRSLKTLGLDYIDLYLIHWPVAFNGVFELKALEVKEDYDNTSLEEKWAKMEECVRLGLTKSIGLSNFNSEQVEAVVKVAKIKPVTNQVEAHPYLNQKKLIKFCKDRDIILTAYSPLGSPSWPVNSFTEKIPNILEEEAIKKLAEKHKKTPAQIILRYMLELGTIVVPKSSNPKRMADNLDIFDFKLSPSDVAAVDAINKNLRSFTFNVAKNHKFYPFHAEF